MSDARYDSCLALRHSRRVIKRPPLQVRAAPATKLAARACFSRNRHRIYFECTRETRKPERPRTRACLRERAARTRNFPRGHRVGRCVVDLDGAELGVGARVLRPLPELVPAPSDGAASRPRGHRCEGGQVRCSATRGRLDGPHTSWALPRETEEA